MADSISEKETVVVDRDDAGREGANPVMVVLGIIVALLILALLFGWFGDANDDANPGTEVDVNVPTSNEGTGGNTTPTEGDTTQPDTTTPPTDDEPEGLPGE